MSEDVETYDCPSPDCSRTFGARVELTEHINTEHAGEYQRDDWPDWSDTLPGRKPRRDRENDEDSDEE